MTYRTTHLHEFDNGYVLFNYPFNSIEEADEACRVKSIEHQDEPFWVAKNDIMDPRPLGHFWLNGEKIANKDQKFG